MASTPPLLPPPSPPPSLPSQLTTPLDIRIKWPNDIYCGGLKLGGALIHTTWQDGRFNVITGVGRWPRKMCIYPTALTEFHQDPKPQIPFCKSSVPSVMRTVGLRRHACDKPLPSAALPLSRCATPQSICATPLLLLLWHQKPNIQLPATAVQANSQLPTTAAATAASAATGLNVSNGQPTTCINDILHKALGQQAVAAGCAMRSSVGSIRVGRELILARIVTHLEDCFDVGRGARLEGGRVGWWGEQGGMWVGRSHIHSHTKSHTQAGHTYTQAGHMYTHSHMHARAPPPPQPLKIVIV